MRQQENQTAKEELAEFKEQMKTTLDMPGEVAQKPDPRAEKEQQESLELTSQGFKLSRFAEIEALKGTQESQVEVKVDEERGVAGDGNNAKEDMECASADAGKERVEAGSLETSDGEKPPESHAPCSSELDAKDGVEEREIVEAAMKKAKIEIAAKTETLRDLRIQKVEAVKKVTELHAKTKKIQKKMEAKKISLEEAVKDRQTTDDQLAEIEEEEREIRRKKLKLQSILQEKENTEALLVMDIRDEKWKLAEQDEEIKKAEKEVKELQQQIKVLPEDPGYNASKFRQLEDQISESERSGEFECPVCFNECSPPIFTCEAQHLICGSCR